MINLVGDHAFVRSFAGRYILLAIRRRSATLVP